ncbi:MAG TPA: glycosyltransferase family 39 protein [bacterium]|nr:glycosyltransferase family 39 protein [bacterium]
MSKKTTSLYLLLIILVAMGLRLVNLGTEPFWGDEALSFDIAKHYESDVPGLLVYLQTVEVHPPFYYLILNMWCRLFGWSELASRSLSLLFGLGIILLGFWLSILLFRREKLALACAFVLAVLPFQVEFSQEARPYIIFCFCAVLSAIIYWRYRDSNKVILIPLYILVTLAGLFLHYSYIFFAVSLGLYWLIEIIARGQKSQPREFYLWLGSHLFIILAYFFQAVSLLYKMLLGDYLLFDTPRTLSANRPVAFFESVFNQLIWLSKNENLPLLEVLAILIFKVAFWAGLVWLIFRHREKFLSELISKRQPLIYLLTLTFLPVIFFALSPFSVAYAPIFERHVITGSVFLIIIIIYLVSFLGYKKGLLLLVLFLLSVMNPLISVIGDDALWDEYFRLKSIGEQININYRPGDLVLVSSSIGRSDVNHYLRSGIPSLSLYPLEILDYHWDFLNSRETLGLNENEAQLRCLPNNKGKNYESVRLKMDYIIKKYQPRRIWFITGNDYNMTKWFEENHWRRAMDSLGELHPLKLYDSYVPGRTN